eukprot:756884-Hanusia_phi.AAC.1
MDEANEGKRGYSIKHSALGRASQLAGEEVNKKKKKKGKKEKGDEDKGDSFKLDLNDPRFASVYRFTRPTRLAQHANAVNSDPKFALDPTDPQVLTSPALDLLPSLTRLSLVPQNRRAVEADAGGARAKEQEEPLGGGRSSWKRGPFTAAGEEVEARSQHHGAGFDPQVPREEAVRMREMRDNKLPIIQ